jgi:glycosyltransferase involved in cell wall biosynthesis
VKVLVVSGIWPPDVGGPASHAPDVADFLIARGHQVVSVVTADAPPDRRRFRVRWTSRRLPKGVIHAVAALSVARQARHADVVYTTGMFTRTAFACGLVRTPYVVKLTGDPAFERTRWRGKVDGDVEDFQDGGGGPLGAVLRRVRNRSLRSAAHIVCPSGFLRELALTWGVDAVRVSVLPNPTPPLPELPPRDESREAFGIDGPTLAFAGRLAPQKALDVAIDAVARLDGVTLLIAGDGDVRGELEEHAAPLGERVRFLGSLPREEVLQLFAAADASLLSSAWENFPHTVVEALAVGAPMIATEVGGVPEIVQDGVNGLLVPPNDVEALADAIERFFADEDLRARLRAAAASSVERYAPDKVYGELEEILAAASR